MYAVEFAMEWGCEGAKDLHFSTLHDLLASGYDVKEGGPIFLLYLLFFTFCMFVRCIYLIVRMFGERRALFLLLSAHLKMASKTGGGKFSVCWAHC